MLIPKEAQEAMLDLRRVASELSTIRKELHEFKLLIAEQNDILRELSKPPKMARYLTCKTCAHYNESPDKQDGVTERYCEVVDCQVGPNNTCPYHKEADQ